MRWYQVLMLWGLLALVLGLALAVHLLRSRLTALEAQAALDRESLYAILRSTPYHEGQSR